MRMQLSILCIRPNLSRCSQPNIITRSIDVSMKKKIERLIAARRHFKGINFDNFKNLASVQKKLKSLYENEIIYWNNPSKLDDDGWIYCYYKENLVKIGKTRVSNNAAYGRLKQYTKHYDLGEGWKMHGVYQTKFCTQVESKILKILKPKRLKHPEGARELFNASKALADNVIMEVLGQYNDPAFCIKIKDKLEVFRGQVTRLNNIKNKIEEELEHQIALHRKEAPIRYVLDRAEKLPKLRSNSPIINFFERIGDLINGVFAFGYLSLILFPFILLFGWLILEAGEFLLSIFSG